MTTHFLRTPDSNFTELEGFSYQPNYVDIADDDVDGASELSTTAGLRMAAAWWGLSGERFGEEEPPPGPSLATWLVSLVCDDGGQEMESR